MKIKRDAEEWVMLYTKIARLSGNITILNMSIMWNIGIKSLSEK
jgi:hypothetical protein